MSSVKKNCKFNNKQHSKINYGSKLDIDKNKLKKITVELSGWNAIIYENNPHIMKPKRKRCKLCMTLQDAKRFGCFFFCNHVICEKCALNIKETQHNKHNTNDNFNLEQHILGNYVTCPYCRANTDFDTFTTLYFEIGPDLYNFDFNTLEIDELRHFGQYIDTFI